jgi:Na+/phosphate symporter
MPLRDGTITISDVIADQVPGLLYLTMQASGVDAADYASIVLDPANTVPLPSLATLQAAKPTTQTNLAAAAKAQRVNAALQAQQDQIANALRILADGIDQLNNALKPTSFTSGTRPTITNLAGLRTKLAQVLATP